MITREWMCAVILVCSRRVIDKTNQLPEDLPPTCLVSAESEGDSSSGSGSLSFDWGDGIGIDSEVAVPAEDWQSAVDAASTYGVLTKTFGVILLFQAIIRPFHGDDRSENCVTRLLSYLSYFPVKKKKAFSLSEIPRSLTHENSS